MKSIFISGVIQFFIKFSLFIPPTNLLVPWILNHIEMPEAKIWNLRSLSTLMKNHIRIKSIYTWRVHRSCIKKI